MKAQTSINVRFSDCDPIGHTNNASYFTFFEQARVTFVRKLFGLKAGQNMSWRDFPFILAEISCKFLKPSFPDQNLSITASTGKVGNSSFFIDYDMKDAITGESVATGTSALVWYDYDQGKSVKIPDDIRSRLLQED